MVTIVEAVETAKENLAKIMPDFAKLEPNVEEFGISKDGDEWIITFRARNDDPSDSASGTNAVFIPFVEKVVRVGASNGQLLSVRNPSYDF
jgi:hypothetical protein